MFKRAFDLVFSILGIVLLSPLLIAISLLIKVDSKGPVLYLQQRVGKKNHDFYIFKFRSMRPNSDKKGLLTVGKKDSRITRSGYLLRKYKLDELPQLFNVLKGDMSFVGPRPEVRKYVSMYNKEQLKVLSIKPGITDYASIKYSNENDLLAAASDPEKFYIENIFPEKIKLNLAYINDHSILKDVKIILKTIFKIIR